MKKAGLLIFLLLVTIIILPINISFNNVGANGDLNGEIPDNDPTPTPTPIVDTKTTHPWCRFGTLTSRTGNAVDKFVTFTVSGLEPSQARFELSGLGLFEVKGLNCVRHPMEHICTGYVNGLPNTGTATFYSGSLAVDNEVNVVCTVSKALVPPPVYTPPNN